MLIVGQHLNLKQNLNCNVNAFIKRPLIWDYEKMALLLIKKGEKSTRSSSREKLWEAWTSFPQQMVESKDFIASTKLPVLPNFADILIIQRLVQQMPWKCWFCAMN